MKQHYIKVPLFLFIFVLLIYLPDKLTAQCNCSAGVPATPITYYTTISPSQSSISGFSFPKFDPSVGNLQCVRFLDTVSVVVTTFAHNDDSTAGHNYLFQTTISDAVNGPKNSGPYDWLADFHIKNQLYGPVFLDSARTGRDTVTFGPDTLISNAVGSSTPPDLNVFIGTGVVNFNSSLTGGAVASLGGTNYTAGISTNAWGSFRITYYWCPASVLANSMTNFSAIKSGDNILLQWTGQNDQNTDTYDIEYSKDGTHFSSIGKQQANLTDAGNASKYQYQYNLTATDVERIFFRIKKTNATGKSGYSQVRVINLGATSTALSNFQIYPNPASKHVNMEWSSPVTGKVGIGILNTVGQQLYGKMFELKGNSTVNFDIPSSVSPGIYYLLVKDLSGNTQQLTKLVIR